MLFKKDKLYITPEEKQILKFLIALGTPGEYRAGLWKLCSGAKKEIDQNPCYYENLLKMSKEVPSLYEKQIDKDISRTNAASLKKNPELKQMIKNILLCYSIRNSSIGYCQGFNFLVLRLLEVLIYEVR